MFKTIKCITGRPNLGWITLNNHFPRLGMLMVVHYPMVKPLIKHGGIHLSDLKGIYLDITDITSISKKDVDIVQSSLWLLCHVFFGQKRFGAKMVKPSGVRNGKNVWNIMPLLAPGGNCTQISGVSYIYIHSPWYDCIILYRCLIKSLKMSKTKIRRKKKFFGWYRWYPQGI
jgi:hypothetical protein